jgi:hypothetical protein
MIQHLFLLLSTLILHGNQEHSKIGNKSWKRVWATAATGNQIYTDHLGDVYLVKGDQLSKYKSSGAFFRVYSNKNLGKITSVDAANPLKIIVFYRDFSRVVFLDNTITDNGEPLKLDEFNMEQASLVCWSYDNGIWIYDPIRFSLTRLNQQLKIQNEILNLNQILGFPLQPAWMIEADNYLFISTPDHGILQFDVFGTYMRTIPIKGIEKFDVSGESIIYTDQEERLHLYQIKTFVEDTVALPRKNIKDFAIDKNRMILLTNDSLYSFQYFE